MILETYSLAILVYLRIFAINGIGIIRCVVLLCLGKDWAGIVMRMAMITMSLSLDFWGCLNTCSLRVRFGIFIFYFTCFLLRFLASITRCFGRL